MVRRIRAMGMRAAVRLAALSIFATLVSCNDGVENKHAAAEKRAYVDAAAQPPREAHAFFQSAAGDQPQAGDAKARFANFQAETKDKDSTRRIIYEAEISLVVKSMTETETQLGKLLKQFEGYVGESNVDRRQGQHLTGQWKVRVPAPKFDDFLDAVAKLGVAESRRQTAQDVSAEFVDLEAQITNKKRLEERIIALLKDTTGKIKDVIEVEHELARVRGEIEQMEGRLRYLTNRTDLTTVNIVAREEENYVPPAAPTFVSRITEAWSSSLGNMRLFAENLAIVAVAVAPWLVVGAIVLVPTAVYARKRAKANGGATSDGPTSSS